jgi:dipeptidyl-peptidase-4
MYLDLPRYNAAGYEYASNLKIAGNLKGKLLLTHGTSDVNAPFGETIRMVDALTRAGKTYELMILPEETHALTSTNGAYRSSAERHFLERHLLP